MNIWKMLFGKRKKHAERTETRRISGQPTADAGGAARKPSVSSVGTSLIGAVAGADVDAVQKLLAQGANVNQATWDGRTALHEAAYVGNLQNVKLLVENGANVNANCHSGSPLHVAAKEGRKEVVEYLLASGADVNLDAARLFAA